MQTHWFWLRLTARPIRVSILCALIVVIPCLFMPLMTDDYFHLITIEHYLEVPDRNPLFLAAPVEPLGHFNLFELFDGNAENIQKMRESGVCPWWTFSELRIRFWRPLSSVLFLWDYQLFGANAFPMHIHNILWYVALIALWGAILCRCLPPASAGLALLLFAIDDAHYLVAMWSSNRNALVSAVFGALGLWLHIKWRDQGSLFWRLGSALSFAACLTAGEAGLGLFGFLAAYEFMHVQRRFLDRLGAILPALVIGGFWLTFYLANGYGASGSGLYRDAVHEPLSYLLAVLQHIPTLMAAQFLSFTSDFWLIAPVLRPVQIILGTIAMMLVVAVLRWIWPQIQDSERRFLRWILPGGLLALLPVCSVFPLDRLLLLPGLAGTSLLAIVLRVLWNRRELRIPTQSPQLEIWSTRALAFLHILMPVANWVLLPAVYYIVSVQAISHIDDAPVVKAAQESQRLVVLMASDPAAAMYLPPIRYYRRDPMPTSWHIWSMAPFDHRLTRKDDYTLELEIINGTMLTSAFETLIRSPSYPFAAGERIRVGDYSVEVLEVKDGQPCRMAFQFDKRIEETHSHFAAWQDGGFATIELPAIGQSRELKRVLGPNGL